MNVILAAMRKRMSKRKVGPVEHGIAGALYSGDGEKYHPNLVCLCGWMVGLVADSWEQAGEEMDNHLAETRRWSTH